MKPYGWRDQYIIRILNWVVRRVCSKEYVDASTGVVQLGMIELDKRLKQQQEKDAKAAE